MSFTYVRKLPEVDAIKEELGLSADLLKIKEQRDAQIKDIFEGKSDKKVVIIGPCSADNEDSVCDYIGRLKKVQDEVEEKLILIPRIYTNKPRTTGAGYKGMAHQPDPTEDPNIVEGIKAIRKLHIRAFSETHLTAADEMLYPTNYPYLEDLLSYVAIGARSVENQHHRLTVSGLDIPCGMKNPTSGCLNVMLNSVQAAQMAHTFVYNGWEVKTNGNDLAHTILRGAVNSNNQSLPNYHYEDLLMLVSMYQTRELENPGIIVDANHANSNKKYKEQPRIVFEVVENMKRNPDIASMIKGFMVESYIEEGSQKIEDAVYGKSITDPCLGWEDTKALLLELADRV